MPHAISIFPIWCVLTNPMHSTKIDMFIGDIFIITSAIIISVIDIQRIRTNKDSDFLKSAPTAKDVDH